MSQTRKLLKQDDKVLKLKSSLRKVYCRNHDMFQLLLPQSRSIFPIVSYQKRIICSYISNTKGATCGAGSVCSSGASEITIGCWWSSWCSVVSCLCCWWGSWCSVVSCLCFGGVLDAQLLVVYVLVEFLMLNC